MRTPRLALRFLCLPLLLSLASAASAATAPSTPTKQTPPPPPPGVSPSTTTGTTTETKFIPLPIYATEPNEGSTFGLLPVFLFVEPKSQRTLSIMAPSISWNRVIHETGTFRYYYYPNDHQTLTFIASGSTVVNWGGLVVWENNPREIGETTDYVWFRYGRNLFYRFFGLGPYSMLGGETSHTRIKGDLWYRKGYNVSPYLNIGAKVELSRELVQHLGVSGYPLSPDVFPYVPGMGGGSIFAEALDIRYDTRENHDYSLNGQYVDFAIGPVQGLSGGPDYWQATFEAKGLLEETDRIDGGARLYWRYESSPQAPFFYQSSLGGSFLMRGFTDDRFFDQGAWTIELEQRIQLFQTHIYGVTTDWRVDPFVAIGQVYGQDYGPFSNVRVSEGLGFRAWVRPNVLGRVDVATGGEGLLTYVELGYPF